MTSFLEHLSHNICRVIFWNFGMTSASICRINICRITFIVKNMILVSATVPVRTGLHFLGISVTSFLEHLSHNICRVIFWNFGMASAIKYLSHKHLSHNVYCKTYDPCKRYNTSSNRISYTVRIN